MSSKFGRLASTRAKEIFSLLVKTPISKNICNALEVNGDYPPHLHFQIINDLQGNFGDYLGVCSANELDFYKENCPDPNLILKLK